MNTIDIPVDNWNRFFDTLSRLHVDEYVRIEIMRDDFGAQVEVTSLPFNGISADLKDGECSITVSAAAVGNGHVSHQIDHPTEVRLLRDDYGSDRALEIIGQDDSKTLIYFPNHIGE